MDILRDLDGNKVGIEFTSLLTKTNRESSERQDEA